MTSPRDLPTTAPRAALWSIAGLGLLVLLAIAALIDASRTTDRVQRNVVVAGQNVGGMTDAQVESFLDQLEGSYRTLNVAIVPPQGAFNVSGADLGVSVDRERLKRELRKVGHQDGPLARVGSYFASFLGTTNLTVPIEIDQAAVADTIRDNDAESAEQPVDPSLVIRDDKFAIKPGKPGLGISPAVISSTLEQLLPNGPNPIEIPVERVVLPSRYTDAELAALLDRAVALSSKPLPVRVGTKEYTITPRQLRRLITPTITNGEVELQVDGERAIELITESVGSVGQPAKNARLQVNNDGTVSAVPSEVGLKCCAEDSTERLNAALAAGAGTTVDLDLVEVQPKVLTSEIESLGVTQLVATFTTKHPPGEVRVKNIHHIADLLRGIVIKPGDTFSVNDTVGPRSEANGFYKAKVIEDGVFAENYGGGISQFATTMFNTAFFAGLDLVEYQSHSLYISRYPYGREATLSYPNPDLKIRNSTPYGVLIWPTYTERAITVSFYSTPYVKGEVVDQAVEERDQCKIVYTSRLRTYVDGTTKKDRVRAFYRPAEGKDCNGNPTAGATTTTLKPRPTRTDTTNPASDDATDGGPATGGSTDSTKAPSTKQEAGTPQTKPESTRTESTKAESTKAQSTKAESTKPKSTKAPEEPKPTAPDDGNVGVGGPPVTGLG